MKKCMQPALILIIRLFVISLAINSLSFGAIPAWADEASASATPKPYLYTGLPQVVMVSGTDYQMGVQYGEQTAPAISFNVAIMKAAIYQKYGGSATYEADMKVWAYYAEKYLPAFKNWLKGIEDGCRQRGYTDVRYLDLVAAMVFPAEMWSRSSDPYPPETLAQARNTLGGDSEGYHSCNSFAATGSATKDGKPMLAISKMVPMQAIQSVILIAFPKDGPSFITFPYAGTVAQNQGMNSAGFAWTLTAISQAHPIWGVATGVYFHYLTQVATSPAKAVAFLESTPRAGTTGNFTMSDAAGNISIFEASGTHTHVRKPGDNGERAPFMVNTNHLVDPAMQPFNRGPFLSGSKVRYATLWQYVQPAATASAIDFGFAKQMFMSDDWYDPVAKSWHYNDPGSPTGINNWSFVPATTQTIFFPATLTAYLEAGTPSGIGLPAYATGEYAKIRLGKDPAVVTDRAYEDAVSSYEDTNNLFQHCTHASYMTPLITRSVTRNLDKAHAAVAKGKAALRPGLGDHRMAPYSEALSQYVEAQLYSQMAKTILTRASEGKVSAYLQARASGIMSGHAFAGGQQIDMQSVQDPVAAAAKAYKDTLASYTNARNSFQHELNTNATYLTPSLARSAKETLDEAFAAFQLGMDRGARAYLTDDGKERLSLYGEALTYYARAQQQSEQVKTMLVKQQ